MSEIVTALDYLADADTRAGGIPEKYDAAAVVVIAEQSPAHVRDLIGSANLVGLENSQALNFAVRSAQLDGQTVAHLEDQAIAEEMKNTQLPIGPPPLTPPPRGAREVERFRHAIERDEATQAHISSLTELEQARAASITHLEEDQAPDRLMETQKQLGRRGWIPLAVGSFIVSATIASAAVLGLDSIHEQDEPSASNAQPLPTSQEITDRKKEGIIAQGNVAGVAFFGLIGATLVTGFGSGFANDRAAHNRAQRIVRRANQ